MNLFLIRHAQSTQNADIKGDWHPDDAPLTEYGIKQAELLALRPDLQNIDKIYSSTLIRAAHTALPLAQKLNKKIYLHEDAIEADTPLFGTKKEEMLKTVPCAEYIKIGERTVLAEEPPEMLRERAKRLIDYIFENAGENENIALFTHCAFFGYPLRYCLHIPEDEPFCWKINNCSVTHIEFKKDKIPVLHCANDRSHLYSEELY